MRNFHINISQTKSNNTSIDRTFLRSKNFNYPLSLSYLGHDSYLVQEGFGIICFSLLDLNNVRHLNRASYLIDKSNGYIYMKELVENENLDSQILLAQNDFENEDIIDEEYEV